MLATLFALLAAAAVAVPISRRAGFGSVLGYLWALLKPLLMFTVMNFVFSSIFASRGAGSQYYSLQLLTSLVIWNFFSEGTMAGMSSLLSKSQLVTKIYVPRWTLIVASTMNSALVFLVNLIIILVFFAAKNFLPSLGSIGLFLMYSVAVYVIILAFAFLTAPIYVRLRDLILVWEVLLAVIFYATPIFYPLQILPLYIQKILLLNPIAFVIHFNKEGLINNHFASLGQNIGFITMIAVMFMISTISYRKFIRNVAQNL